jgi:hypothetical protein
MTVMPKAAVRYAAVTGICVLALLVVLTALGWMPSSGSRRPDGRYDPLTAPEVLGGFPRWHGMADGEMRDAKQFGRQYHAAAIEASYLPPGRDPLLASAVRAHDEDSEVDGTSYGLHGRVRCSSLGVFVECFRTGERLTVNVLAPKGMVEADVAVLVNEFWRAQSLI